MTGTAKTEAEEFFDIYNLSTSSLIPTNKPNDRELIQMIKYTELKKKKLMQ